jgi:uncharacterized protein YbjQ (UPF0145 family)
MLATSCYDLEGYRVVAYRGVVWGAAVRIPTIAESFMGRLKYLIGGKISSFIRMSKHAHEEAYKDMLERAQRRGANAVLRTRFDVSMIVPKLSASEIICYGTAVIVEPIDPNWQREALDRFLQKQEVDAGSIPQASEPINQQYAAERNWQQGVEANKPQPQKPQQPLDPYRNKQPLKSKKRRNDGVKG